MKKTNATKTVKLDIPFIKSVAEDMLDKIITDDEAKKAHKIVSERANSENYYYALKEYFIN